MGPYLFSTIARIPELLRPSFLRVGEKYSLSDLRADVTAGVTVAVIQIPQCMALALIAGLPAAYGLYASLFGFVAAFWGSSRQLSTGPVAIVSFLTLTSLIPFAEPSTPEFIRLAATLALLVGLIYLLMGFFRLGFVLQLVPHSVVFGFSSAAAVVIVITQIPTLLGISIVQDELVLQNVVSMATDFSTLSVLTLLLGSLAIALLYFSRRISQVFPGPVIVLGLAIISGYFLSFDTHGVALVGAIPQSLPSPAWPWISPDVLVALFPKAAIIALVGFVGAHASAKISARKTREHLNTDQELVGQGLANIVTAFFRGFPVSGSFTRTAVNIAAGGRTAMASLVACSITVLVLLFFTPLFFYLPRSVLAAIVIVSALPLIDIARLREMCRVSRTDGFVAFLTFGLVFILKPDDAIIIGIVAALMLFIRQTVWGAHVSELGVDRELQILRINIEEESVDTFRGVAMARIAIGIYYANAAHIVERIDTLIARHVLRENAPVKALVLDVSGVNFIDITGIEIFHEYFENLKERGIDISFIYLRREVRTSLERAKDFPSFNTFQNISQMRHALWLAHK